MGRKKRAEEDHAAVVGRIAALLRGHAFGMHHLREPAHMLDVALPPPMATLYRQFDGGDLFHETIRLWPSAQVRFVPSQHGGVSYWQIGELAGADLALDEQGRVFCQDEDLGEWLPEGSDCLRWLHGVIEAEALLYDGDGEFCDDVIDEDTGELTDAVEQRRLERLIARDKDAPAPRWRLAQLLARAGRPESAREHLEHVVAQSSSFAWAWYDLGRISERLGQLPGALDEIVAAAECRDDYAYAGFFLAHAARLARVLGDEAARAAYAERALASEPDLARRQRDGATALLAEQVDEADARTALELAQLAVALNPRDLAALDLVKRAQAAPDSAPKRSK